MYGGREIELFQPIHNYELMNYELIIINGQILRKETDVQHRKKNSVNVCIKDTKISDVGTVLCLRNICKKRLRIKLCF